MWSHRWGSSKCKKFSSKFISPFSVVLFFTFCIIIVGYRWERFFFWKFFCSLLDTGYFSFTGDTRWPLKERISLRCFAAILFLLLGLKYANVIVRSSLFGDGVGRKMSLREAQRRSNLSNTESIELVMITNFLQRCIDHFTLKILLGSWWHCQIESQDANGPLRVEGDKYRPKALKSKVKQGYY